MTSKSKDLIKAFFETGDSPTQAQFIDLIDSYVDRSGPIGIIESQASAGSTGIAIAGSNTMAIETYANVRSSQGITVYTTALASAVASDTVNSIIATTAQANAGTATGVLMNPVLTKNAIETIAFTSADYSTTAQANAGTDNTTVMTPVLVKNAIATQAPANGAGLTVIASGTLATGSPTAVDITGIAATYRGLVLYISGASNSVSTRALQIKVNTGSGLTGSTQSYHQIAATTPTQVNGAAVLWTDVAQTGAQTSSCIIEFPHYQSGPVKEYRGRANLAATAGSEFTTGTHVSVSGIVDSGTPTGAIEGIRITWDNVATGVFDGAGTYALYGVN